MESFQPGLSLSPDYRAEISARPNSKEQNPSKIQRAIT